MSIFSKSDNNKTSSPKGRDRAAPPARTAPGEKAISIIGPGMQILGDILTEGTVRIEGRVEGTLRAGKGVVIGKGGEIVGDVITQTAVVGGKVTGSITAETQLELQSTCVIDGVIRTRAEHLQLHEGALFNGQIQMLDPEAKPISPVEASEKVSS